MEAARVAIRNILPQALKVYDPLLIVGLTVFVILFIWYILRQQRPANAPKLVDGKLIPFLGAALKMANPVDYISKMRAKHGPIFTVKVCGQRMTYLISPKSQTAFFKANDDQLSAADVYKFMVPVFGQGVVYDAPPEVMLEQMKFVKGGLTAEKMKTYTTKMVDETENFFSKFAPKIGETTEINLLQELADLTILTASRCLIGDRMRSRMGTRVTQLYHDFDAALDMIAFFMPNLPIPKYKTRDRAHLEMKKIFGEEIADRRAKNEKHDDLVDVLLNAQYKDGTSVPEEHIKGMLIGVLFAGQHTSSITATWTGLMLFSNPAYYERVMKEQHEVMSEFKGVLTYEALRKMVVLENAVKETLRMFPPLIFLMRKARQPLQLEEGNLVVPAGDYVVVSPAVGHRNADVYANPDVWDPDRFARGEHTKHSFGWFGFGGGRHGCIGEMFGLQQVKTIWCVLLRDFKWHPMPVPPPDYSSMVVGPLAPVIAKATRIHTACASSA